MGAPLRRTTVAVIAAGVLGSCAGPGGTPAILRLRTAAAGPDTQLTLLAAPGFEINARLAPALELPNGRIVSRAIDNRVGAFVVLEALRRYAEQPGKARVVAVATTQEEIAWRGGGALAAAVGVAPAMAIVWKVDTLAAPATPDRFCGQETIRDPASTGHTLLPVTGVDVPARTKRYRMAVPSIGDAVGQ